MDLEHAVAKNRTMNERAHVRILILEGELAVPMPSMSVERADVHVAVGVVHGAGERHLGDILVRAGRAHRAAGEHILLSILPEVGERHVILEVGRHLKRRGGKTYLGSNFGKSHW